MFVAQRELQVAFAGFLGGAAALAGLFSVASQYLDGAPFDLGSLEFPTARYIAFLALWMAFGTVAAVCFAVAFARGHVYVRLRRGLEPVVLADTSAASDRAFLAAAFLVSFGLSLAVRSLVLRGAPLTDDESAYRFMAEVLASGRVKAPSPPMKLFFDRGFMINDGSLYAQYFLGWPALLVPGVWLGVAGIVNPLLGGLGAVGLFLVVRRVASRHAARIAVLGYWVSPLLVVGAATQMSHTSCTTALIWLAWVVLRARDHAAPRWIGALIAVLFSVAFFIRPLTAFGLGAPLLGAWLYGLRTRPFREQLRSVVPFVVPAAAFGALFLLVNYLQNGGPLEVSYQRYVAYARENGYRFTHLTALDDVHVAGFRFEGVAAALARTATALFRSNVGLLGWPSCFAVALLAGFQRRARPWWALLVFFVLAHFFMRGGGIDTFGPVHMTELCLPVLVLVAIGVDRVRDALRRSFAEGRGSPALTPVLGSALVFGMVLTTLLGYWPVQLQALLRIQEAVNAPRDALQAAGVTQAVVFSPSPFAPCASYPTRHFVLWRDNNDPDLENPILWVNDLGPTENQKLSTLFPDRPAYVFRWRKNCSPELVTLAKTLHPEPSAAPTPAPHVSRHVRNRFFLKQDAAVTRKERGPHAGTGETTAYRYFDEIKDARVIFRKRALHRGASIGMHVLKHDEVYYVVSGRGELRVDDTTVQVGPGSAVFMHEGADVGIRQLGEDDLVLIVSYPPAVRP